MLKKKVIHKKDFISSILDKYIMHNEHNINRDFLTGKAGLLIYYSIYSSNDRQSKYIYNMLLKEILTETPESTSLCINNGGLLGIGISLCYILKRNAESNGDNVLEDLDKKVIIECGKILTNSQIDKKKNIELILYMSIRLSIRINNALRESIFRKSIIDLIERTYYSLGLSIYEEAIPFTLFNPLYLFLDALIRLYGMGINIQRINHILKELGSMVRLPIFHANRLMLLYLTIKINKATGYRLRTWSEMEKLLIENTKKDVILNSEFSKNQINFENGISSMYLFMLLCNKISNKCIFSFDKDEYLKKIFQSSIIKTRSIVDGTMFIGLNGYWGMRLLYDKI